MIINRPERVKLTRLSILGRNDSGQLGQGHIRRIDMPTLLQTLSSTVVTKVSCGKAHTLLLTGLLYYFSVVSFFYRSL